MNNDILVVFFICLCCVVFFKERGQKSSKRTQVNYTFGSDIRKFPTNLCQQTILMNLFNHNNNKCFLHK